MVTLSTSLLHRRGWPQCNEPHDPRVAIQGGQRSSIRPRETPQLDRLQEKIRALTADGLNMVGILWVLPLQEETRQLQAELTRLAPGCQAAYAPLRGLHMLHVHSVMTSSSPAIDSGAEPRPETIARRAWVPDPRLPHVGLHSRHGVQADRSGHQRDSPVPEGDEMLDSQRTGRPVVEVGHTEAVSVLCGFVRES